ncbi:MAG: photosystem II reaction center protein T [Rickettsiales bacterium]|nr:photosystem II reaction center protein T [Rickettsiales bacterium]
MYLFGTFYVLFMCLLGTLFFAFFHRKPPKN